MLLNKINPYVVISLLSLVVFAADGQTLRDPTLPSASYQAVTITDTAESLVLSSVINGASSFAVINNKIMKVGDRVQGVRIVAIGKSQVSLSDGRKLQLFQSVTER
ncbi:MSHA biogenesis protein MshK [Shewanella sp. OMA3-2]|uniref:MSHA biogenesis protein MshK n=1 Tax=Shewanella sp. OMA3-2 TaxID=2908650 RepID=UPI001F438F8F|nr:MSHA biogenesis protein MshK [Shewanella sp. OMA3-2]UJF21989.1 MSHA biogenesis protein MshK [Shewanella sp. OMA3-2]